MADSIHKVLFVNSEMSPYLPENGISNIGRVLPQGIQERKKEIRCFMPKYGSINERKHQLHEVIRLSGMNIIISDVDRPLIIKVASIPAARIQVYFIDNEDYFRRKQTTRDSDGNLFWDNDERAIFFARGVLETVKKLRWAPDIIHCQGWISHLLPVYLKKSYKDDPIFSSSKVVTSLYNELSSDTFSESFAKKALFGGVSSEDLSFLEKPDGINLAKTAARFSDGVIFGTADLDSELKNYCSSLPGCKILPFDPKSMADGSYVEAYSTFYDEL